MILPLANERDKRTQVLWGIRDFERRFGRRPEGMWLAETAVDTETLEALAEAGLAFTILAPSQARRVRPLRGRNWRDVSDGRVDPSRAYLAKLPSGRSIALFFYDGPISRAVAFEGLLRRGEYLADRLAGAFSDSRDWPQLVHMATDGETYGHHHGQGEMALAYALHHIESEGLARLTNYGEYLERHPPTQQVEILEKTAWSCVHGVGRWWEDCGCNSGGHGEWNQAWRTPLRNALDWLRDELAPRFEAAAAQLLTDPWKARDAYIDVILDRGAESRARFLESQRARDLTPSDERRVFQLMELQRHAQLMYTSCGWFFDELSGIETVQVIQYAGAALHLAGAALRGRARGRLSWPSGRGEEQRGRASRRGPHLRQVGQAGGRGPPQGGRALRHQLALRRLPRRDPTLLLLGPARGPPGRGGRTLEAPPRSGPLHLGDHPGGRAPELRRAPLRRPHRGGRGAGVPEPGGLRRDGPRLHCRLREGGLPGGDPGPGPPLRVVQLLAEEPLPGRAEEAPEAHPRLDPEGDGGGLPPGLREPRPAHALHR